MTDYIKGIDVSIVQGALPFQAIVDSGVKFVIAKCAEGNKGIDPNYTKNIQGAKSVGLLTGLYHFLYPLPPLASQPGRDPVVQAQMHFRAAGNLDVPVHCIDAEWPSPDQFSKWGCSPAQINDWCHTYLVEYTRLLGKKPVVYVYPFWANAVKFSQDIGDYPLWIASYQATPYIPKPWNDWQIWQNSGGTAHLPNGVPVDSDLAKDLSLWGVSDTPTAAPNPVPNVASQPDPATPQLAPQAPTAPATEPTEAPPVQVAPSPARPPHPQPPIDGFLMMIVNFLRALFHI
jgi:lysozyme